MYGDKVEDNIVEHVGAIKRRSTPEQQGLETAVLAVERVIFPACSESIFEGLGVRCILSEMKEMDSAMLSRTEARMRIYTLVELRDPHLDSVRMIDMRVALGQRRWRHSGGSARVTAAHS